MPERAKDIVRRPLSAAILLLLVYVGLSFLNDPGGTLGADTGAKAATLDVMSHGGGLDPDVGYWAEQWDPTGALHPFFQTKHLGDRWVATTTFPMLYAALPLYEIGGYRLALLLPMLGSVAAALAARAVAQRCGSKAPWRAFWVVGLASPLTVYALDFWEHSIGVALVLWAAVLLWDTVERRARWWKPLAAGACLGFDFTMRTEALVYFAVLGAATAVVLAYRRRIADALLAGTLIAGGAAAVVLANLGLELATIGESVRLTRASGTVSALGVASTNLPGGRVPDALTTTLNLDPSFTTRSHLLGGAFALAVAVVAVEGVRRAPRLVVIRSAGAVAAMLLVLRINDGLGFVPGLLAAAPLAAAGVVLAWRAVPTRWFAGVALVALPLVLATMFTGGALPQWAGRYQLPTTMLLVAVAVVALERASKESVVALVALSLIVTAFGVAWLHERSNGVAEAGRLIGARSEPVLVTDLGFLPREIWKDYRGRRQLVALDDKQIARAAEIVVDAGFDSFAFVTVAEGDIRHPTLPGWRVRSEDRVDYVSGVQLVVESFVRL